MKARVCQYLGLKNDSDTALSYPSPANHCYRINPVTPIKIDHQEEFCLSGKHRLCLIYQGEPGRSKKNLKVVARRSRRLPYWIRHAGTWLFPSLVVLASIIALVLFLSQKQSDPSVGMISEIPPTHSIESTKTFLPPTPTSSLTLTPVVTLPAMVIVHALEVPIGTQTPLLIHRVKAGESLALIAKTYNTTEEAITSLNYNLSLPLWPNLVIVIPLNQVDVINLPQFQAYEILESLSLKDLEYLTASDFESLLFYNSVEAGHVFMAGEWVLIPHLRQPTPSG
jgi:hypothetical protein